MNDAGPWITFASLLIAMAALIFGAIQYRRTARKDYVEELDRELEKLRGQADECERDRDTILGKLELCDRERAGLERQRVELLLEVRELREASARGPGPAA